MDFERFQQFMLEQAAKYDAQLGMLLESSARHDAQIALVIESLGRVSHTLEVLVNNQVHLQQGLDRLRQGHDDLRRIVFRHVTDPDAHTQ